MILNIPPTLSQIRGQGALTFIADGSALASASKTQLYSDGNAGSLLANVPTGKYEQHKVAGVGLFNLGRSGNIQGDTNFAIGKYGGGISHDGAGTGISGIGSNLFYNIPTGGMHQFCVNNGSNVLEAGGSYVRFLCPAGTEQGRFDSGGLTIIKNLYFNGAGTASSTLTTAWTDASAGNLFANVPTGKYIESRVAGSGVLVVGKAYGSQGNEFWGIGPHPAQNAGTKSGIGSNGVGVLINAATGGLVDICSGNAFILRCASTGITITDGINLGGSSGSATGNKLGTAPTQKWSFWGATPVVQPALTGTSTTLTTAGSTNALYADSTSTGGTGSTAYSLPDVIKNLKTAGLLAP